MFAKGYVSGKVWKNGLVNKDFEAIAEGNNDKMHLVVRDKDVVSDMIGPTNDIMRVFFSNKTNAIPLEKRLLELTKRDDIRSHRCNLRNARNTPINLIKTKTMKKKRNMPVFLLENRRNRSSTIDKIRRNRRNKSKKSNMSNMSKLVKTRRNRRNRSKRSNISKLVKTRRN
jgi:hypothetical protein